MGRIADIYNILKNVNLLDKLSKLPDEVEVLTNRVEKLEKQKLGDNPELMCRSCKTSPVKVTTLVDNSGRLVQKTCDYCDDRWTEYPDEKTPSRDLSPSTDHIV